MTTKRLATVHLDEFLHPAQAFLHPSEVVNDPDLSLNEKRAILASWASDACAIEAAPALRSASGGSLVSFDDIMDALRILDKQANGLRYRHVFGRRNAIRPRRSSGGPDSGVAA
jgi:hypothetical protein